MAIYHLSVKIISCGKGQSAIASAAYRSGERLYDKRYDEVKDFSNKRGIVYSDIQLPSEAPLEYLDRETLWNAVERAEKKSNAQLSREIEVALPRELDLNQQKTLLRDYIQENFVSEGMCADWSIHDKKDGNPHAHIMLTVRSIKKNGTWAPKRKSAYKLDKNGNRIPVIDPETGKQKLGARNAKQWKRTSVSYNNWNDKEMVELWRKNWARSCNKFLDKGKQIDHRSYERQGKLQLPTKHEGYYARKIEQHSPGKSEIISYNKQVRESNKYINLLLLEWQKVQKMIVKLKKEITRQKNLEQERIHEILRRAKRAISNSRETNTTAGNTELTNSRATETDTETLIRETRAKQRDFEAKRRATENEREKREAKQLRSDLNRKSKVKKSNKSIEPKGYGPSL
ncbi:MULTISPECIES: MobQ family relaxase [Lactobacillaceae]|uniref:MobQ family relaxase n=1 Tax=Lactobacillaceae TaxID=33958 RepID=UPI00143357E8|nr:MULTISPECIES: MobQ family relaxase [Lactobacillaceae]BDI02929.1 putative mobilization protein MobA [Ligilactobacillus murinus]GFI62900.1 mobilization protein A [Lactobacillaceae bacterium]